MTKAIAALSGGLDSILAAKLILEQGIDVEAAYFLTVFSASYGKPVFFHPRNTLLISTLIIL